jgi:hypothetical protein
MSSQVSNASASSNSATPLDTLDPLGRVSADEAAAETEPRGDSEDIPICDEDLDAAAELFDGDDSDPLKFIEKSMHYQDMMMSKKQAEERVKFFNDFKKTMPAGKDPIAKIREYQARLDRVNSRIKTYEAAYAKKRVEARKLREKRNQQVKEEKESYDQLPKMLKSAITKTLQKRKLLASKAAVEAIAAIAAAGKNAEDGKEVSDKEKLDAGFAAFAKTFGHAFEGAKVDEEGEDSPPEEA